MSSSWNTCCWPTADSDDVYMVGKIAAFQIQNLLVAYKERFDKDNFIKNLLLDNLLLVDIYNRAKKLHIETDVRRVVYIIEINRVRRTTPCWRACAACSARKSKDFITAVDEKNLIVVKEIAAGRGLSGDRTRPPRMILDLLNSARPASRDPHRIWHHRARRLKEVSRLL